MNKVFSTAVTVIIGMAFLTSCQQLAEHSVTDKMATVKASQTQTIVNIKDVLDSNYRNHSNANGCWLCRDIYATRPERSTKAIDGNSVCANGSHARSG